MQSLHSIGALPCGLSKKCDGVQSCFYDPSFMTPHISFSTQWDDQQAESPQLLLKIAWFDLTWGESIHLFDVFEYVSIHLLMSSRGRVSQDNGQTCMKYFMQNHAPRGNSLIDFHPTVFVHVWRRESEGGPNRETRTILNRLFFPYSFCTSRPRLSKWWNCRFSFVQFSFIEYTNTKNDFWNGNSIPTHDHTLCTAR